MAPLLGNLIPGLLFKRGRERKARESCVWFATPRRRKELQVMRKRRAKAGVLLHDFSDAHRKLPLLTKVRQLWDLQQHKHALRWAVAAMKKTRPLVEMLFPATPCVQGFFVLATRLSLSELPMHAATGSGNFITEKMSEFCKVLTGSLHS